MWLWAVFGGLGRETMDSACVDGEDGGIYLHPNYFLRIKHEPVN